MSPLVGTVAGWLLPLVWKPVAAWVMGLIGAAMANKLKAGIWVFGGLAVVIGLGVAAWKIDANAVARTEARHEAEKAKVQQDLTEIANVLNLRGRQIEHLRAASADLKMEIEDEARSDPNACIPSSDSLRRLDRRWGSQQP